MALHLCSSLRSIVFSPSPCGVAGGNPYGCPEGDPDYHKCFGVGFANGPFAEHLNYSDVVVTEWERGSIVEVSKMGRRK